MLLGKISLNSKVKGLIVALGKGNNLRLHAYLWDASRLASMLALTSRVHDSAVQEAKAVAAVQSELETFQAEMQQASLSQRQMGQAAVDAAVQRAQRFVDRTLRLTNLSTLSAYVIGQGPLPVSRSFQGEILGDATRQLTDMVSEHSIWLRENCDRQVRKYRYQALAPSGGCVVCLSCALTLTCGVVVVHPSSMSVRRMRMYKSATQHCASDTG